MSYFRHLSVNAFGRRSASVAVKASPFALLIMTTISSPNSIRLCRHMPQGDTGSTGISYNRYRLKFPLAAGYGSGKSCSLRTDARSGCCILNVASRVDPATAGEKRCAHQKSGVRGIGTTSPACAACSMR